MLTFKDLTELCSIHCNCKISWTHKPSAQTTHLIEAERPMETEEELPRSAAQVGASVDVISHMLYSYVLFESAIENLWTDLKTDVCSPSSLRFINFKKNNGGKSVFLLMCINDRCVPQTILTYDVDSVLNSNASHTFLIFPFQNL